MCVLSVLRSFTKIKQMNTCIKSLCDIAHKYMAYINLRISLQISKNTQTIIEPFSVKNIAEMWSCQCQEVRTV